MKQTDPVDEALPDHAVLANALRSQGVAVDPSELHGSLCGYLAGAGRVDVHWLQSLQIEAETPAPADGPVETMRAVTLAQMAQQDFGFGLLLPADEEPVGVRADALIAWCQGFLGGFGLAAPPTPLSPDATEALQDIGRIAAADLTYDGSETDEQALAEIVEFVRVAALLLHGDCTQAARRRQRAN
jgi:uncharacterized protein YgfB (UPF0149 family)